VLNDLAALTPPLLVCVVFIIAVVAFLRHEMAQDDQRAGDERAGDTQENQNLNSGD
jgi:hypothetical protein